MGGRRVPIKQLRSGNSVQATPYGQLRTGNSVQAASAAGSATCLRACRVASITPGRTSATPIR